MKKILILLVVTLLAGCGGSSDSGEGTPYNKPSVPNPPHNTPGFDVPIPYFSEPGHQVRILKRFEFEWSNDSYRGIAFHYGKRLQANEKTGDGRGCVLLQSLSTSDMGPIPAQDLKNISPIKRDSLGSEVPDDFRFSGVQFDFTVVGSALLYCFRHESLGPVTLEDFRDHFAGYLEFTQ